jgi:hypothetical protein
MSAIASSSGRVTEMEGIAWLCLQGHVVQHHLSQPAGVFPGPSNHGHECLDAAFGYEIAHPFP